MRDVIPVYYLDDSNDPIGQLVIDENAHERMVKRRNNYPRMNSSDYKSIKSIVVSKHNKITIKFE